eukprot:7218781-Pyramimonas_sp.AAC.1
MAFQGEECPSRARQAPWRPATTTPRGAQDSQTAVARWRRGAMFKAHAGSSCRTPNICRSR